MASPWTLCGPRCRKARAWQNSGTCRASSSGRSRSISTRTWAFRTLEQNFFEFVAKDRWEDREPEFLMLDQLERILLPVDLMILVSLEP